jgi:hypothetical protein
LDYLIGGFALPVDAGTRDECAGDTVAVTSGLAASSIRVAGGDMGNGLVRAAKNAYGQSTRIPAFTGRLPAGVTTLEAWVVMRPHDRAR